MATQLTRIAPIENSSAILGRAMLTEEAMKVVRKEPSAAMSKATLLLAVSFMVCGMIQASFVLQSHGLSALTSSSPCAFRMVPLCRKSVSIRLRLQRGEQSGVGMSRLHACGRQSRKW